MNQKLVWGLPIRAFHWSLLGLVSFSLYTGHFGDFDSIDLHMWSGYGIITLVLFRLSFGLLASGYARFTNFVKGPSKIRAFINQPAPTTGHNPLGSLGVVALLMALFAQAGTGLFVTDDIFVEGPLYHLVSTEVSGLMTTIHAVNQWLLLALIAMHIIAILVHEVKGDRIVWPMVTGKKELSESEQADRHQFLLAAVCLGLGVAVTYIIAYVL